MLTPSRALRILSLVLPIIFVFLQPVRADVITPGTTSAFPDLFAGCSGCTLLASADSGQVTESFGGVTLTFDLVAAVYADPSNTFGVGDLDFVYQVTNESSSTDSVGRVTTINFSGFQTDVGFTFSGSTLPGGQFVDGTVAPGTIDRNTASTIGFDFTGLLAFVVAPGQTSNVMVIETNATNFGIGETNVIDGQATTVHTFEPTGTPTTTPEPESVVLLGIGLLAVGLIGMRRAFA